MGLRRWLTQVPLVVTLVGGLVLSVPSAAFGVIDVTGVSLDPAEASVPYGGTQKLTATVIPGEATNAQVTWQVSGSSVELYTDEACTLSAPSGATNAHEVYAKGVALGEGAVTVASDENSTLSASSTITVGKAPGPDATISDDLSASTSDSLSLEGVAGQEYIVVRTGATPTDADWAKPTLPDSDNWVSFEGLEPATEYDIYTRVAETDTTCAMPTRCPARAGCGQASISAASASSSVLISKDDPSG